MLCNYYYESKTPVTKTVFLMSILKTITYFDMWSTIWNTFLWIPATGLAIFNYLDNFVIFNTIYNNTYIGWIWDHLINLGIWPSIKFGIKWGWVGITYVTVNTPIGAIIKYMFVDR